ncbi:prepilin-type N-terminal cleavage/methylation domain-containing protein [Thalassotalea euphylliae]|uniref:Type II secretion system protein H n=1 Tax=Thalassotalea euphylliae TaxID=1655234 RepID=A0A3E0TN57_9GAMM|nr:GspH/FimT family pseudopilin [Thalassotalea euphylliae]REL26009.1 prepilin-type N-terminal cleavage/methylation domain-containing protein [Thalassotalea euphylliae]
MKNLKGFTIVELMVTIAILGLMIAIAIPSFSEWVVRMRVDNEISSLQRLILTTRNTAINMEHSVTMCPLDGDTCSNKWNDDITVFIDLNGNGRLETGVAIDIDNDGTNESLDETIIRIKDAVKSGDKLSYSRNRVTYRPTGKTSFIGTFNYCPKGHTDKVRGIKVSLFGRAYQSKDTNNDGMDEFRDNTTPSC